MSSLNCESNFSKKFYYNAALVLLFLLISRLILMHLIPLMDSTEARYGEIAREMLRSGNWITLLHNNGMPFLAKPPLSTWLSAFSMSLFGVNELSVRLPGLLLSTGILWLVWDLVKKRSGSVVSTITVLFLAGNLYFYLNAGTVMTDPTLIFCTTLSMLAFWRGMIDKSKCWAYLFFIGQGLGLLAKGPIAVILTAMPIFTWILLRKQWRALWLNLPWIKGCLIVLAIALPWYIMAEIRNPGFLNYFIIGENFNRFYVPAWNGNHYGFSHAKPYGMIWIYTVFGLLPWSLLAIYWLFQQGKKLPSIVKQNDDGWLSYLFLWMMLPLLFFTFSRNIIYTYVFPSLPAAALLFAELWRRSGINNERQATQIIHLAALPGLCCLVVSAVFLIAPGNLPKSHKPVITAWKKQNPSADSQLIYWGSLLHYSAQFYSDGHGVEVNDLPYLRERLAKNVDTFLVIKTEQPNFIPAKLFAQFTEVETTAVAKKIIKLYRKNKKETF